MAGDREQVGRDAAPAAKAHAPRETPWKEPPLLGLQGVLGKAWVYRLQAPAPASPGGPLAPALEERIQSARGGGGSLDGGIREAMESSFGTGFAGVRVHTGGEADTLSRALSARAFTTGRDIFFRGGEYRPGTSSGDALLAHELTHVVQQGGAEAPLQRALEVAPVDDAHEREAEAMARRVAVRSAQPVWRPPGTAGGHSQQPRPAAAAGRANAHLQSLYFRHATPGRPGTPTVAPGRAPAMRVQRAPGPLTPAREAAARAHAASRFDARSVRIIQLITGTGVDGVFGDVTAQAVATWQGAQGLGVDGRVGPATLDSMVADRVAAGRREHAIQLVVDSAGLDVTTDTLTVHFDRALATPGATRFEAGNVRVITVGPAAFASAPVLLATIQAQLAAAAPAAAAPGPRPAVLTRTQELRAQDRNQGRFRAERSVRIIQGHVGSNPDGAWGPDTVQRVAQAQTTAGLVADGIVGLATLELFVTQLIAAGQPDSALRLIVDFFAMRANGNLLDIHFDPGVAANAETDFRPNEPVRLRVGPVGIARPFAQLVHTIAHEMEHVRRLREGIAGREVQEFLGEAVEILSVGMPEEPLEAVAPGTPGFVAGFASDAERALDNWNLMPLADRRRFRARFIAVRRRVRARIAAGTAAQQVLHAPLLAGYNTVVVPPP